MFPWFADGSCGKSDCRMKRRPEPQRRLGSCLLRFARSSPSRDRIAAVFHYASRSRAITPIPSDAELRNAVETLRRLTAVSERFLDKSSKEFAPLSEVRAEANRLIEAIKGAVRSRRGEKRASAPRSSPPLDESSQESDLASSSPSPRCYSCQGRYEASHSRYARCCWDCGDLFWRKRQQSGDLTGRIALVTGGRFLIGREVALKLLRAGATVVVTTRFPRDAVRRFAEAADFDAWSDRLRVLLVAGNQNREERRLLIHIGFVFGGSAVVGSVALGGSENIRGDGRFLRRPEIVAARGFFLVAADAEPPPQLDLDVLPAQVAIPQKHQGVKHQVGDLAREVLAACFGRGSRGLHGFRRFLHDLRADLLQTFGQQRGDVGFLAVGVGLPAGDHFGKIVQNR